MNEEGLVKIDFSYTDEFGQKSQMVKTYADTIFMDQTAFEVLVDEFKTFMRVAGFLNADKIQIVDDNYDEEE